MKNHSVFRAFLHACSHLKHQTGVKQFIPAFSLVEMLMALLVASLLLAALAPVMTRKMSETISVSGVGEPIIPTGGCIVTEGLQENFCEIPQNTYSINAIIASAGGGGGGAAQIARGSVKSSSKVTGNTGSSTQNRQGPFSITKNMSNLTIQLTGGGGGAGGGWSNEGGYPGNTYDCRAFGSVYVAPEQNPVYSDVGFAHSTCVSRYNPNHGSFTPEQGSPAIPSNVVVVNAGEKCSSPGGSLCCWKGNTSRNYDTASGYNYSGGSRTVCQFLASQTICKAWAPVKTEGASSGRLPTEDELTAWAPHIVNGGVLNLPSSTSYGLQLCSDVENNKAPYCNYYPDNRCMGNTLGVCWPSRIWTSTVVDSNSSYHRGFHYSYSFAYGEGTCSAWGGNGKCENTEPYSVRCVVDKISGFVSYLGGSGGAGIHMKVRIPDNVIKKATKNGGAAKLYLTAGYGGTGTEATSADTAKNGGPSKAELYDENNVLIWMFQVPGGNAGRSASKTANGAVGARVNDTNLKNCFYYYKNSANSEYNSKTAGAAVACTTFSDDGIKIVYSNAGGAGLSSGRGADGYYDGTIFSTSADNIPTSGTSCSGSNGGGGCAGKCVIGPTRLTPKCSKGGSGGGGAASYSYQLFTPGSGGGGGAAGAVVHLKNITNGIKPGLKITMKAGNGGTGGQVGTNGGNGTKGNDGEASYISYSNIKYEVAGGKGGNGATAGKPDASQIPKSGTGGAKGNLDTSKLNSLIGSSNYKYYPADLNKTAGKTPEYKNSYYLAPGGNGGINSKISPYTSLPCGGLSEIPIDYYGAKDINENNLKCNQVVSNNLNPTVLLINEITKQFKPNMATIMSEANSNTFAGDILPGSTGGGGGAWQWNENEDEKASKGANGMKGYAIIYWNLKDDTQ